MSKLKKINLSLCFLVFMLLSISNEVTAQTGMVMITDMGLIPKTMTFKKDEKVELIIHNKDDVVHSFVIPKLNLSSPYLMEGEMASITFIPRQIGTFHYHANTSQFGDKRFTGSLIITE